VRVQAGLSRRRHPVKTWALKLFVAVGILAGCSSSPEVVPAAPPPQPPGHQRMLDLLEQVADEAFDGNPYLGRPQARLDRAELASLDPAVPDLRRWLSHIRLGKHELRMGNTEEALEHYSAAYAELVVFVDEIPIEEQIRTTYELAVAHLRRGETDNCALRHTAESCIFPIRGGGVHSVTEGSEQAIVYLEQVLAVARSANHPLYYYKAQWLLNIAYMTLGKYPDGVPQPYLIPPSTFESDADVPRFKDVAPDLGLNTFDLAGGAVAEDFDGDGQLDLVVTSCDTRGQMRLFKGDGEGGFTERTEEAGLTGLWGGLSLVHADYDNDGFPDLFVLRGAWWRAAGHHPNSLLHNNGDGTFTDVTFDAGLAGAHYPTQAADWGDYDNDGDLVDLYIGNEFDPETQAPCQLFRNNGDGTFTDVAEQAGVLNERYAKAVAWGDFDGDRDLDLFVSNMGHRNRLYRNDGDGGFTDIAVEAGVIEPIASFPTWFWDFDNDGLLDLFVAAYGGRRLAPDVASVVAGYLGIPNRAELDHLYRGDGRGGFEDVAASYNLDLVTLPMGSNFGDLNNDGFPDYYLGTGYPYYEGLMPNLMFLNQGGERFLDVTTRGGFGHLQKGHGVVFADLDNDGDQDVFEQMGGFFPGDAFGNALFENPGFGNHWVKVRLVGTRSNSFGVGARIKLEVVDEGGPRVIYRHVGTGGNFGSNPLTQEIGLGAATRIERLEVYWPTSDTTQSFEGLAVDRRIEITEGGDLRELPLRAAPFRTSRRSD
jgi:hypothetical protein